MQAKPTHRRSLVLACCAAAVFSALLGVSHASAAAGLLAKWGSKGTGDGQFQVPVAVAVDPAGNVYVADLKNRRIQKFNSNGAFLGKWDTMIPENPPGSESFPPQRIAADSFGNVFVTWGHYVLKYSSDGAFLGSLVPYPEPPNELPQHPRHGQFAYVAVATDPSGNLYVGAAGEHAQGHYIQRLSPTGALLGEWDHIFPGSETSGLYMRSLPLAVSPTGTVFVTAERGKVLAFAPDGTLLAQIGSLGSKDGQFRCAFGLAADKRDNVYVVDPCLHRVQKFSASGSFLGKVGDEGKGFGGSRDGWFSFPFGVAVDPVGNIYVADSFNNRIQKLGPDAFEGPAPHLGVRVTATVVSGTVRVRRPGSRRFVRLKDSESIPVGSVIDTRHGRVRIVSATNHLGGTRQADFYSGIFKLLQKKKPGAVTEARLVGKLACGSRGGNARPSRKAKRKTRGRLIWGDGRGGHRSTGKNSSASVRGTRWLVWDRCDGSTLTRVTQGRVAVRDFAKRKTVLLRKGQRYVAGPRRSTRR